MRCPAHPTKGQISYWDDKLPSFGFRVSQGGTKTFVLNRKNSLITIGRFPTISLSQARTEAKRLLAEFTLGKVRPQSITYTEAVDLLRKSGENFEFPIDYGSNLQSEHERWLTEKHFKCPVTVFNFPKEIKPFYMRSNEDGRTVAAIDLLVPGIGEIVGGSQREERLEMLEDNMRRHNMDPADYKWYLDLRRYGTVPHSGFGLGFERMLMFITGISNIRDVIPFARTPGSAEF